MATEVIGRIKRITTTVNIDGSGSYTAEDVVADEPTGTTASAWTFSEVARRNEDGGYIIQASIMSETTALTPRLTLFLFNITPTCELNDMDANTAVIKADREEYLGKIDFPALSDLGTGMSEATVSPSTVGGLPLAFKCAQGDDDLYGVLVTHDVFDNVDDKDITITLTVEQY